MNIKKFLVGAAASALMLGAMAVPALASSPQSTNLLSNGNNWRIWNIEPSTAMLWDINKAQSGSTGVTFPFQQFQSTTTGSFAVYLEDNYNVDLTGNTITATAQWTPGTAYVTRGSASDGAYARAEFQDVASGPYTSSDYWWYSGSILDLNAASNGTITAPLTDRAHWTNICGQVATDTNTYPGPNCVGGTDPAVSPYDGFTNAMKNVKEVSLSFGNASRYASGVAWNGDPSISASFDMSSFTVAP